MATSGWLLFVPKIWPFFSKSPSTERFLRCTSSFSRIFAPCRREFTCCESHATRHCRVNVMPSSTLTCSRALMMSHHVRSYSRATSNSIKRKKPMNRIKQGKIRVIDEDGGNLGEMASSIAIQLAESKGCKLHQVHSGARGDLPVYKIMSQKAIFDTEKRKKEQAKLTRKLSVKEVQITTVINDHDFDTKLNHAKELLRKGHGIQLCLVPKRDRLSNTRVDYPAVQQSLLERFLSGIHGYGKLGTSKEQITARGVRRLQIVVDHTTAGETLDVREPSSGPTDDVNSSETA